MISTTVMMKMGMVMMMAAEMAMMVVEMTVTKAMMMIAEMEMTVKMAMMETMMMEAEMLTVTSACGPATPAKGQTWTRSWTKGLLSNLN